MDLINSRAAFDFQIMKAIFLNFGCIEFSKRCLKKTYFHEFSAINYTAWDYHLSK